MIFSAPYSAGANLYFIRFKLQEKYWLVIDRIISLNRHRCLPALSKRSFTLIVITICSIAQFASVRTTYSLKPVMAPLLCKMAWKHQGNLSLTCPKLIPLGVKRGIGFKDWEVARVLLLSAGPSAPLVCHFIAGWTRKVPNWVKHHHRLIWGPGQISDDTLHSPYTSVLWTGIPKYLWADALCREWKFSGDPDPVTVMSYYLSGACTRPVHPGKDLTGTYTSDDFFPFFLSWH